MNVGDLVMTTRSRIGVPTGSLGMVIKRKDLNEKRWGDPDTWPGEPPIMLHVHLFEQNKTERYLSYHVELISEGQNENKD